MAFQGRVDFVTVRHLRAKSRDGLEGCDEFTSTTSQRTRLARYQIHTGHSVPRVEGAPEHAGLSGLR